MLDQTSRFLTCSNATLVSLTYILRESTVLSQLRQIYQAWGSRLDESWRVSCAQMPRWCLSLSIKYIDLYIHREGQYSIKTRVFDVLILAHTPRWYTYMCGIYTCVVYIHVWYVYIYGIFTYVAYMYMWYLYLCGVFVYLCGMFTYVSFACDRDLYILMCMHDVYTCVYSLCVFDELKRNAGISVCTQRYLFMQKRF